MALKRFLGKLDFRLNVNVAMKSVSTAARTRETGCPEAVQSSLENTIGVDFEEIGWSYVWFRLNVGKEQGYEKWVTRQKHKFMTNEGLEMYRNF